MIVEVFQILNLIENNKLPGTFNQNKFSLGLFKLAFYDGQLSLLLF